MADILLLFLLIALWQGRAISMNWYSGTIDLTPNSR